MPVYMRITIDGQQKEMTTARHCDPQSWNQKAEKAFGKTEKVKELNNHLTALQVKVFEARRLLIESCKEVTAEAIKNLLTGQVESVTVEVNGEQKKMFIEANPQYKTVNLYNDKMQRLDQEQRLDILEKHTIKELKEEKAIKEDKV